MSLSDTTPVYAWSPRQPYSLGKRAYSDVDTIKPIETNSFASEKQKLILFTPRVLSEREQCDREMNAMDIEMENEKTEQQQQVLQQESKITPRKYQDELFNQCKKGNVITVAPTGAGKTLIAVLVMQHALRTDPKRKVLFVVNKIPLVLQQGRAFQKQLPEPFCKRVGMFYSDRSMGNWDWTLTQYDVIVCTVQSLLNALKKPGADLSLIQLLVFDECHHARANHPYRMLMKNYYFPWKRMGNSTPRILGLSASPAANNTTAQTLLNILQLCHDLDCKIRKVEENEKELNEVINLPFLQQREVEMDSESINLRKVLSIAMHRIKNMMIAEMSDDFELSESNLQQDDSDDEDDLTSENISKWIQDIVQESGGPVDIPNESVDLEKLFLNFNEIDKLCITKSGRISLLGRILNVLSECLIINDDRSCYQAWKQLLEFQSWIKCSKNDFLLKAFKKIDIKEDMFQLDKLPRYCQKYFNLSELLKEKKDISDFRALVFVKTRVGAMELKSFLEERNEDFIKVNFILGHGTVRHVPGMSSNKQKQILEDFKSGKINVLIATSVAEEGVDISSCKLVARMSGIDSALQLIQSRGRARSKDSEFFCIYHKQSKDAGKLIQCISQEQKMTRAVSMLVNAEQYHSDIYMHKLHLTSDETDYTMNMSHIWESIWFYEKNCQIEDSTLDKIFEKYKNNLTSILTTSIEKMLGIFPAINVERDIETGKYLGYVSIPITNKHPNITKAYQAATRQLIYADQLTDKLQEAKNRAVMNAVKLLKDKDLLIFPSNSWVSACQPDSVDSVQTMPPKKKKKITVGQLSERDIGTQLNVDNSISILQYHCIKQLDKKSPSYTFISEEDKLFRCICLLPDGKVSVKSDGFSKKKNAKKNAAFKMCEYIIKRDGFIQIPDSFL